MLFTYARYSLQKIITFFLCLDIDFAGGLDGESEEEEGGDDEDEDEDEEKEDVDSEPEGLDGEDEDGFKVRYHKIDRYIDI